MVRLLGLAFLSFLVSAVVVWSSREVALRRGLLDRPNERSSHKRPVPRVGGIGIVVGIVAVVAIAFPSSLSTPDGSATLAGVLCVALLGLADDLSNLRIAVRFIVQLAIAGAWCALAGPLRVPEVLGFTGAEPALSYGFSVIWIVWVINLFNFMDGVDAIAGAQAVVAGATLSLAFFTQDAFGEAVSIAVVGASLGFLLFNFPPATIFMGDVGSTALGFLFAVLAIRAANTNQFEFPAGVLAIGPFVFDATFTLVRRMLAGEKWYQSHRSHLYQRPQRWGVGHASVAISSAMLMVFSGLLGHLYHHAETSGRVAVLLLACVASFAVAVLVLRRDAREREPAELGTSTPST